MSTYEDTSDISLEDISGEFYAVSSRPCNVFVNKSVYEVNVNGGGPVAVGSYASITGVSASKPTEEYEKSPSLKSHEIDSKLSYYARNGEDDYCPHNYYIQTIVADWTPKPLNGILIQEGEIHFQWSVEFFLENSEKFIREMDTCAGSLKEEKELFILHGILPYLEQQMWGKSGSNNIDVYKVLAHVSSSRGSGDVAKRSLQQLEHLLYRDRIQSAKQNLLSVEKILRLTIVSPDGALKEEADSIRLSRLKVYGCILSELIIHQSQARFSKIDSENNLKQLREIENFFSKMSLREKDFLRYSIEFIRKAISYLTQPLKKTLNSNLGNYLEECKRYFANSGIPNEELSLLKKLKKSEIKRCELHCILYYLHRKVYTERPEQVNQEWRTMDLLDLVLKAYLDGGGGEDWRFCLLASSILSEIAMKNATKALRLKASSCLDHLRKNEKARKRPECRAIIDGFSREMLFSPDSSISSLLVTHFYDNQTEQYTLPTELHNQHLASSYRTHNLEIDNVVTTEPSCETSRCFVSHGVMKQQEVAVKVLAVSKGDLAPKNSSTQSGAMKRLRKEAYNLWQLGNLGLNHPNIPYLLAYNTVNLPHHIITPYEKYGNLLHFVRSSRERRPLSSATLYKMIIGVIEALQYLHQKLNLVHRAVMAENVLVGAGYVPKLSGMHSLEVLQRGVNKDGDYDYVENHDDLKDFIGGESETLSVRYKAPETLSSNRYSTASDVWAFGVFLYETFTLGCRPYRGIQKDEDVRHYVLQRADNEILEILPQESCIKDDEYNQMKQCWKKERSKRIDLSELKEKFKEVRKKIVRSGDEEPRLDPPSLKTSIESAQVLATGVRMLRHSFREKSLNIDLADLPRKIQLIPTSESAFSEKIKRTDDHHLRGLLALNHANLVAIWKIDNLDSHHPIAEIITIKAPFGDLKSYVLENRCQIVDIVTFLSQVASAMHYLHFKHIVHGDLRATYVNVVTHNKIQVGRLGRSKPLSLSKYEDTSTLCVVQAVMPTDSTRWSAPEVILDGHYTHASDVWSFGILAWELYTSFADGLDGRDSSLPFFGLNNQEILPQIRHNGPPTRPEGCPEWVHIIMHQCWAYVPQQRPPFLAVFDCLTSREPMKSWIMKLWLQNHDKSKWPDLSIRQPQDACHVTNSDQHPSSDVIEKMCSPDFFSKHEYKYVSRTFFTTSSDDDYSKAYGTSDMQVMRNDLEYQTACGESTMEVGTPELVPVPEPQKTPNNDESGYLCPVSIKIEDLSSIESNQANVSGVADFPRSHEQKNVVSSTGTFYLQVKKVKKRVETHDVSAIDANEDKVSLMDDKPHLNYVNLGPQPDQHHAAFYQNIELVPKEGSCELEEDAKKAAAACEKPTEEMNGAVYCKVKKTKNPHELKDQLVPLNHQLYANVDASSVTTHALPLADMGGEQSDMETIHKEMEAEQNLCQTDEHSWNTVREKYGAEKNGSNSSLSVWLKDPELEVVFYV